MTDFRLRLSNAAQIVTVCAAGERLKAGPAQRELAVIENGTIIVAHDGTIAAVGPAAELAADPRFAEAAFDVDEDATGKAIIPGLVDGHTHAVWAGNRVNEFAMKLAGATYMEVHAAGGGIHSTVRATRAASDAELEALLRRRLDRMLRLGTTLVEVKSGYGLDAENEVKMLRVATTVARAHAIDTVHTFCGAHAVPEGSTAAAAADDVIANQLPAVLAAREAGAVDVELADVFVERGVFEVDDGRRVLEACREAGLALNFHGDELAPLRTGVLGAQVGAVAISHLEEASADDIAAMAAAQPAPIVAVLLPTTAYVLHLKSPPARGFVDGGVPVALGSDFNPNAHCLSMPQAMNLACVNFGLTMDEALVGATINAAASMGRADTHGSLEVGKVGDLVLLSEPNWQHIIYEMVDPPICGVYKGGVLV